MSDNFVLFSNIIPVRGANRSTLCDLQNNRYYFIPNGLFDILGKYHGKSIDFIKTDFNNQYDIIIDEYFEFLVDNKLVFFDENPNFFPKMDLKWDTSSKITNMVIDYEHINHDFESIILQLEDLKCSNLQIRFFKHIDIQKILEMSEILEKQKSRIISIDFIIPLSKLLSKLELKNLLIKYPRIHSIIVYNSNEDKTFEPVWKKMGYLMFVTKNILNEKHCGVISTEYFYSNVKLFSESQKFNTCLNRKIAVDKEGNIKNCPSMKKSFGNITNISLEAVINHKDFKKYWNISKDQISICKDCEFRHVCTDCRAYIENPDDEYSKPLKCGYDPYINVWKEWSTNPLKEKAIEYYGMQDLIKSDD